MSEKTSSDVFKFSPSIPGDGGNYDWPVTLDYSEDGYLGILQACDGTCERVLLSPGQLAAIRAFIRRKPRHI